MTNTIYKISLIFVAIVAIASFGAAINTTHAWGLFGGSTTASTPSTYSCQMTQYMGVSGSWNTCAGSDTGLTSDGTWQIYPSCGTNKCAGTCNSGFHQSGAQCVADGSGGGSSYSCTGNTSNLDNGHGTANLDFCSGSSSGLSQDTQYDIYQSCGANKCAYTCKPGYTYSTVMGTSVSVCIPVGGGGTALSCSPSSQTIGLNLGAKFEATGGNGSYSWSISDSSHCSGNTESGTGGDARYWPQCSASGYKTVTVTSGSQTATCGLTVTAPASYSCTGNTSNLDNGHGTANLDFCSGSSSGLSQNTQYDIYPSCSVNKCAYTCKPGYTYSTVMGTSVSVCIPVVTPQTHLACVNNACTSVSGAGTNSCSTNNDCAPVIQHHNACVNNSCVVVTGAGSNSCSADADCAPAACTLTPSAFYSAWTSGQITGSIAINGNQASANITNNTNCAAPMSLVSYKMFDNVLSHQVFYDGGILTNIPAHGSQTLTANIPSCMAQVDLYYGTGPHQLLDSNPYSYPNVPFVLTWAYPNSGNFCSNNQPLTCTPANQNVNQGQSANFAAAGGTGTYVWSAPTGNPGYGDGSVFSTSYNYTGDKTVTVTSGNQTANCNVHVNTPPPNPLYCNPGTQTVSIGANANFTATGGSGSYSWAATGGAPGSGNGSSFSTAYYSSGSKSVTVSDGTQTAQCLVSVTPVTQTLACSPSSQTVNIGDIAVFSATGGSGSLTWTAAGGAPGTGNGTNFSTAYSTSGTKTVSVTDGTQSAQCSVSVNQQSQSLTCSPATQTANTNSIVNFTAAGGSGTYSWTASGGSPSNGVSSNFSTAYSASGTKTVTVSDGNQTAQCSVVINVPVCTAPNAYLTASTNVTQYSATLNGFIDPQGGTATYYFEYGTSNSFGYTSSQQTISTAQSVSATISNLQPNTTYYFRLDVSNSCGQNQGSVFSFTTGSNQVNNPIFCSTSNQNVNVGDWVNFTASGGSNNGFGFMNYNYYWSAPWDANPTSGNGQSFGTRFSQSGSKMVTVTSAGGQTAQCIVNVNQNNYQNQNQNLTITKNVLNRTLGQSAYVQNVDAREQDLVEFEIRINAGNYQSYNNNNYNNNVSVNVRDILPYGLTYVNGSTRLNGSQYQDGITSGGIYLNNFYSGQDQVIRFLATVNQGQVSGTLTNQATASMNNINQSAYASVNIRPRGTVLGAADIVTGPGDNLPWILSLALITSALMYYFFFNGKVTTQPSFNIKFAEESPVVAEARKKTELEKLLDQIKAEELKADA